MLPLPHPASLNVSATPAPAFRNTPALELPVTGQALRQALARGDSSQLMRIAAQLRVLGSQISPEQLAQQLLTHGCAKVHDAFGQEVPLHVHVPAAQNQHWPEAPLGFRIAL
jgi:hypothetical protein